MTAPLPLTGLRAFVAVGRRGSVKGAAAALGVTPGAVSQQVKQLETHLGAALLERLNREVRLTPAGRRLFEPLAAAFEQMEEAVAGFDGSRGAGASRQALTVTTATSFAATWLVPRLGRFSERHPGIDLRIETSQSLVDLRRETGIDVALRHGLGSYPGLVAEPLVAPRLLPVCSPALLAGGPPIREPADCLRYPLLQDSDRADWPLWLRACGVREPKRQATRGPSFTDDLLALRAAAAGQGIALVRDVYAGEEIASGRVVVALDRPWPTPFAYYVVTRPEAANRPKVAAFRSWLRDEAALDAAGPVL
ncbi:MAG: transcriptional regulator GcvA [Methylobacteriaceae bacterium]|nr:transcriptional regulator GcvA [Methylobacteriaceae bacterium]